MWRLEAQTQPTVKYLKTSLALAVLLLFTASLNAQLTRIWETGLHDTPTTLLFSFDGPMFRDYDTTAPITNYLSDVMTVNSKGETIVAGTAWIYYPPFHDRQEPGYYYPDDHMTCVVKFDSQGNKLWEHYSQDDAAQSTNHQAWTVIQAVECDDLGNVYCLAQFRDRNPHPLTIFKLAADDGHEIWRRAELKMSVPSILPSAMKVDATGNATVTGFLTGRYEPYKHGRFVMRYDADGQRLWYRQLPNDRHLIIDQYSISHTLALTADGGAVVVGAYSDRSYFPRGFAVRIDKKGRFSWLKVTAGRENLPPFSSTCVGSRKTICASGPHGHAVFSPDGAVLNKASTFPVSGQAIATTGRGGFVLADTGLMNILNSHGRELWWASFGAELVGMASVGDDHLLTVNKDLLFINFDATTGDRTWFSWAIDYYPGHVTAFHAAPDGTARLLVQENGITIAAYPGE